MRRQPRDRAYAPINYNTPRASEMRESEQSETMQARPRVDVWKPSTAIELPHDPYFEYRWVVEYTNGDFQPGRVTRYLREGWQIVSLAELPPGFIVDPDTHGDGHARHGGLIMMRLAKELAEQRRLYYRRRHNASMHGADELQGIASRSEPGRDVVSVVDARFQSVTGRQAFGE